MDGGLWTICVPSQCRSGLAARETEPQVQGLGGGVSLMRRSVLCVILRLDPKLQLGTSSTTAYIPSCFDFL